MEDKTPLNEQQIDVEVQEDVNLRRGADLLLTRKDWEQWQAMLASRTHPRRLMTLEEMSNVAVFRLPIRRAG